MENNWIQTYCGIEFYPLNPRSKDIAIEDIAHALSNQCRFAGHCDRFYSVCQHSVLVSRLCLPQNKLWGLLHDASEAYLVDLPSPLKQSKEFLAYSKAEKKLMNVICEKYGLQKEMPLDVKEADYRLLLTERNCLMSKSPREWFLDGQVKPYDFEIKPWSPKAAYKEFMRTFKLTMEDK